ncbi:MAG: hypothetical protein D6830_05160 [Ignavibacteria bacterium]|nr:MAG: hypothetical protein D6830_05160 [Ignavibacteria bacterium]
MKNVIFFLLFNGIVFAQHSWPLVDVDDNMDVPVEKINSNLGDFRHTLPYPPRFHLGIDIQAPPPDSGAARIYPVFTSIVTASPYTNPSLNGAVILELVDVDDDGNIFPFNEYGFYEHLVNFNPELMDLLPEEVIGPVSTIYAFWLADGNTLELNHLHFNHITDLNYTPTDPNDDRVLNPFDMGWDDFAARDITPPILHNLHAELTNGAIMEALNYPGADSTRFFPNDTVSNFYRISYADTGEIMPPEIPRVLIRNIGPSSSLNLILQATDKWNDTGLTPHEIQVYLDQNSSRQGDSPYYSVEFDEIHNTGNPNSRPNANIVYNNSSPLATKASTLKQYYRLYSLPSITDRVPTQIVNDSLNIDSGDYSEEGMHRIEIILKSESVNTDATNPQQTTTGVLYFYLLKNNGGGDNSYLDLAQSSP